MNPRELLDALHIAERLKDTTRHCTTSNRRPESVAEHSWRMALMAYFIGDEFPEADMDRVVRMCLIHDLGEAFTGDIPTFLKKKSDEAGEEKIFDEWVASFPKAQREHWQALLEEMNGLKTDEAKIYKCLDKLEALISHNESDISTWLQLEYDLQFAYGKENMKDFAYFVKFREAVDAWTQEKIDTEKPQ